MKVSVTTALNYSPSNDSVNGDEEIRPQKISIFALGLGEHDVPASTAHITEKQTQRLSANLMQKHRSFLERKKKTKNAGRRRLVRQRECDDEERLLVVEKQPMPSTSAVELIEAPPLTICGSSEEVVEKERNSFDDDKRNRMKRMPCKTKRMVASSNVQRHVNFGTVEEYKFNWAQGYDTVPSSGSISLGMEDSHHTRHVFKLDEYARYRKAENRIKMANWRAVAQNSIGSNSTSMLIGRKSKKSKIEPQKKRRKYADKAIEQSTSGSESDEEEVVDESAEEEEEGGLLFDQFHVFDPMRRMILANCGVPIEENVAEDTLHLLEYRSRCGCRCPGRKCLPSKCECAINGIQCQVDNFEESNPAQSYPCTCSATACKNPEGRVQLDPVRIRNHFHQTLMRLKAAKKMGLEESGEIHSPQHIIFRDDISPAKQQNKLSTQPQPDVAQRSNKNESISAEPFVTIRKRKPKPVNSPDENGNTDAPINADHGRAEEGEPLFPKTSSLLSAVSAKKPSQIKRKRKK